jgi:RNA polymerase sigma-70 factor (ECF subfamily)
MALERARLLACHAAGQQAWPGVELSFELFAAHIERLDVDEGSCERQGSELYLVAAVLAGNGRALAVLDREYVRAAGAMAARLDRSAAFRDEVEQQLRVRLVTGPEPRLALYRGISGLIEWMRVAAWRIAVDAKKHERRLVPTDDLDLEPLLGGQVDGAALRGRHLADFRSALEQSFRRLAARERTLLRLHFVNGLNIDAIGAAYGVHRATAARWLIAIRRTLFEDTRALLPGNYAPDSRSMRSLYRLLEPELHLTLSNLLETQSPDLRNGSVG